MAVLNEIGSSGFSRTRRVGGDPASRQAAGANPADLAKQIAEKRAATGEAKANEVAYDQYAAAIDMKLQLLEQQRREARKCDERETQSFRETFQGRSKASSNDIIDRNKQNEGVDTHTLGVASMQVFEGEDLGALRRRKEQGAAQRAWATQQVEEKQAQRQREREMEMNYAAMLQAQEAMQARAEAEAAQARSEHNKMTAAENRARQEEAERATQAQRESEQAAKEAEQMYLLRSALLTEDPSLGVSTANPLRPRPDHYKGMNAQDTAAIRRQQEEQRAAARQQKQTERDEEARLARDQELVRQIATLRALQLEQQRRGAREELAQMQLTQKEESVMRDKTTRNMAMSNTPDEYYFQQFGRYYR